jgi:ATP/maltotriose-dependent transcriptional regulator MalT
MRKPQQEPLTARETQVLQLVARGVDNAEIGRQLPIGKATVKSHLLKLFKKLDVSDRTAAVTTAMVQRILLSSAGVKPPMP